MAVKDKGAQGKRVYLMDKVKISVVIASYNGSEFLVEQLDSIRSQTLPPDELIICDDLSKDNTVEVAENYIKEHNLEKLWRITVNEKNMGYADNFDNVAKQATGDLIFFSDQDDVWNPDKIEIMSKIMAEHPECKVLCSDYTPWYTGDNAPQAPRSVMDRMPDNGVLETVRLKKRSVYIGALGCCMCVRREFYSDISDYRFPGWAQDDRMWKMGQCIPGGCLILHRNLIKHRIHGSNTSTYGKYHTVERRVKLFNEMVEAEKQMLKYLEDNSAGDKETKIINKHISMMGKRISLILERKILNCISLIAFLPYYERKKSYFVEIYMALKVRNDSR